MRFKALDQFCAWLENTPFSQAIQTTHWAVPAVQTIHILAIAAVMAAAVMIHLRVLGVVAREQPLRPYSSRFLPVIWWALPVLLVTGILMIVGEPARALKNPIFQLKMLLVLSAIAVTLVYQVPLKREPSFWTLTSGHRAAALLLALVSLCIWIAIVFAGRWIAYI
jgi:hypothetical protein